MDQHTHFEYPDEPEPTKPPRSFFESIPNPFYIISAALFVHGTVLPADGQLSPATQVALSLAYILLCAVTTVWLIRRLGRWDDARSLVIIVTGMILAVSLELDDGLALLSSGSRWLITNSVLAFAICMFELIRRGCQIALAGKFIAAFYVQWAVILLYPAAMSSDVYTARWQIALFPLLAVAGWLLYWPSLGNAKPDGKIGWSYPLCPWTLPVLAGAATLVRLYFLTVSFDPIPDIYYPSGSWNWTTILGYDFAVPFLLAGSLLLAESGRRSNLPDRQHWAINIAVLSVLAAMCPVPSGVATEFRLAVASWFELPTTLVVSSIVVLTFHWMRQIQTSGIGWIVGIVAGGLFLPSTEGAWSNDVGLVLLGTATVIGLIYGYRNRNLMFWGLGVVGIYLALFRHVPATWAAAPFRVPEMSAVLLLALAAFRFRNVEQQVLASLAGLAWAVMIFPSIRSVLTERIPVTTLILITLWIAVAIPFVVRFHDLPLVVGAFGLIVLAVIADLLLRLLDISKSGRVSLQIITLAGAVVMFGCGVLVSREKTRREMKDAHVLKS